jgi:hypothetical protein
MGKGLFHAFTYSLSKGEWSPGCVLSLCIHFSKESGMFKCESLYTYNFVMLFQNIEDPNIDISS